MLRNSLNVDWVLRSLMFLSESHSVGFSTNYYIFFCEKLDASECFNLGGNQNISMWDLNLEEQFLQKMFL